MNQADRKAEEFVRAATEFRTIAESLDEVGWRRRADADQRPLGTIVHHVALGYAISFLRILAAASGYPQPIQQQTATERNAHHAARTAEPERIATLQLLDAGVRAVTVAIRSVEDDEFGVEVSIGQARVTIARLVDGTIEHVLEHRRTILGER